MDESEDFATLFARSRGRPHARAGPGRSRGAVIQITSDHVFVDVGGKGEAWIDRAELTDDEGRLRVARRRRGRGHGGRDRRRDPALAQAAPGAQAREALEMAAQSGVTVEGRVAAVIKGGYEVTVGGLRAFCPFSQMDLRRVESEQDYVGRVLEFRVTQATAKMAATSCVSRRLILQEQAAKAAEETRKKLVPDAILPGTVTSLADFGAFVDLGGMQGLVPMSELSHSRVGRASDRLSVGEAVTVKVLQSRRRSAARSRSA